MRSWNFAPNIALIPRISLGIKKNNQFTDDELFLKPYRAIVCSLFLPNEALSIDNNYQLFTIKLFLNYLIQKKFSFHFPDQTNSEQYLFVFTEEELNPLDIFSIPELVGTEYLFEDSDFSSFNEMEEGLLLEERLILSNYLTVAYQWLDEYYHDFIEKIINDENILGHAYNVLLFNEKNSKKKKGQYFSPLSVVRKMIQDGLEFFSQKEKKEIVVMDPAGGGGIFLLEFFNQQSRRLTNYGYTEEEILHHLFTEALVAMDSDPIAVHLIRISLSFLSGHCGSFPEHIYHGDFFLKSGMSASISSNNIISVYDEYPVLREKKIDWIATNPPWGSKIASTLEKKIRGHYRIGRGEINSFTIFIEHALDRLHQGGLLSMLVPQSLLNIRAHQETRRILLNETRLINITLLGDIFKNVYAPAIWFHAEKQLQPYQNRIEIVHRKKKGEKKFFAEQDSFLQNPFCIFQVESSPSTESLLRLIHGHEINLSEIGMFYLGIVTGNNKNFLQSTPLPDASPIVVGTDIDRYQIKTPSRWIYFRRDLFQQAPPMDIYHSEKKLLYRFISNELRFALDTKQRYHLNSINGFILKNKVVSEEYLLALLNSKLLNFFYKHHFFSLRVLRGDLLRLPIRMADQELQSALVDHTRRLIDLLEDNQSIHFNQSSKYLNNFEFNQSRIMRNYFIDREKQTIENIIFDLYKIPSYLREQVG